MSIRALMTGIAAVAAALLLGVGLWALTYDVYSDTPPSFGVGFCGSAYDVALLKKDGYMGGEMPGNEEVLDEECVGKARRWVALAGASGLLGLAAGSLALLGLRSRATSDELAASRG